MMEEEKETKFITPCGKFFCLNWEPGFLVRDVLSAEDSQHWIKLWHKLEDPKDPNKKAILAVTSVAYGDPSDLGFIIRFENPQSFESTGNPYAWQKMMALNRRESKWLTCVLALIRNEGYQRNDEWDFELTIPGFNDGVTRSLNVKVTDELDYSSRPLVRISQSRGNNGKPVDTVWYLPLHHIMEFVEGMYEAGRCVHAMERKQGEDLDFSIRMKEQKQQQQQQMDEGKEAAPDCSSSDP